MGTRKPFDTETGAFRKILRQGVMRLPEIRAKPEFEISERLQVNIVFTEMEATRAALEKAVDLILDLAAETRVIVPHVVPFPLPLDEPAVPLEFTCQQLLDLAGSVGVDSDVDIYLCRDRIELLLRILSIDSIVVIGTRRRWFPTKAERLARALRKNGCDVVLARYD